MRDQMDNLDIRGLIFPAAGTTDNTAWVSGIIDLQGFDACTFVLINGTATDPDASFAVTLEHGDDPALADTAVPAAADLVGTAALAGGVYVTNKTHKLGYIGNKRYVRLTVTPTDNNAAAYLAGVAILGRPRNAPTVNPPA